MKYCRLEKESVMLNRPMASVIEWVTRTDYLIKAVAISSIAVPAFFATVTLFSTVTMLSMGAQAQDLTGKDIAELVDQADSGWQDEEARALMTLYAADGRSVSRRLRSRSLEVSNDGNRNLVIFDQPLDVKGTVFLTHTHDAGNDDQWLFLPAIKRIKRISSSNRSGPFMGSEFAYEDISSEEVSRYRYDGLHSGLCSGEQITEGQAKDSSAGLQCYIYNRYPVDKSSGYTRQIMYVDKEHYRIMRVDYFDRKNSLQKTLKREQYLQVGKFWRAKHWVMQNHLNNKKTIVEWGDWKFTSGFGKRDFEKSALDSYR